MCGTTSTAGAGSALSVTATGAAGSVAAPALGAAAAFAATASTESTPTLASAASSFAITVAVGGGAAFGTGPSCTGGSRRVGDWTGGGEVGCVTPEPDPVSVVDPADVPPSGGGAVVPSLVVCSVESDAAGSGVDASGGAFAPGEPPAPAVSAVEAEPSATEPSADVSPLDAEAGAADPSPEVPPLAAEPVAADPSPDVPPLAAEPAAAEPSPEVSPLASPPSCTGTGVGRAGGSGMGAVEGATGGGAAGRSPSGSTYPCCCAVRRTPR